MRLVPWPHLLRDTPSREIPLTKGQVAIVDADDYEWLSQWKWHVSGKERFYAMRKVRENEHQRAIHMHRVVLGVPRDSGMQVDHINGDRLDNRRSNLRVCTNAQNQANSAPQKGRQYKGVSFHKGENRWRAQITVNGRLHSLRYHDTQEEAARAYDRAARKYFGEFARPNFPEEGGSPSEEG